MISRLFPLAKHSFSARNYFATATLEQVNYYNLLGVESGATQQQISKAYNRQLRNINPSEHAQTFKQLSEAFVILSNGKSRQAYDSLLKARRFSYLNDSQQVQISQRSYLSQRKQDANRIVRKAMNIDEFGRYKGGLPKNNPYNIAQLRGSSANSPGSFATRLQVQNYADRFPQFNIVDTEVAESFKNHHQKDRRDRTMKQPWFNLEVDYTFFTFKTLREKYLPWLRIIAVFGFAIPVFWVFIDRQIRLYEQKEIRAKPQTQTKSSNHH